MKLEFNFLFMPYASIIKAKSASYSNSNEQVKKVNYQLNANKHNQFDFLANIEQRKVENLSSIILKTFITRSTGMHPRKFCRRWFGLETLTNNGKPRYQEKQILAMESEYGYREKCINLLARLLKIKPNTIQRWGKGVEFNRIAPDKLTQYETYLSYIDTIRVMTVSCAELDRELLINFAYSLSVE